MLCQIGSMISIPCFMVRCRKFTAVSVLFLLISVAPSSHAELLSEDSATYSFTGNGATINNLNGGTGWAGAWSGAWRVTRTGMSQGLLVSAGERFSVVASSTAVEAGRTLNVSGRAALLENGRYGAPGTSLWAAFLMRHDYGPVVPPGSGGVAFYSGTTEALMAGWPTGQANFGLIAPGTPGAASSVPITLGQPTLLVVRFTFNAAGTPDEAALFVNPPETGQPTVPDAILTLPDIHFDRLVLRNTGGFTEISLDEIRLATTFDEAAPSAALQIVKLNGAIMLNWPRTTQTLRLLTTTDFGDPDAPWLEHPALPQPLGTDLTVIDTNPGTRRFYRLFRSGYNLPVISNVVPPPVTMTFDAEGAVTFGFSDADGDFTAVDVSIENELGTTTTRLSASQLGPLRRTGTLTLPMNGAQMAAGENRIRLTLVDREGLMGTPFNFTVTLGGPGGGATPAVASVVPSVATVERPPRALDRVRVPCQITWSDADGDVERVRIRFTGPGTNIIREFPAASLGLAGASGTFSTPLADFISTHSTGAWSVRVVLIDRAGNRSPEVAGAITLAASTPESEPQLTSFTPRNGLPGTLVRFTGIALPAPAQMSISLGGMRCAILGSTSLGGLMWEVIAEIPDGADTGPFILRTENRVTQSAESFTVPEGVVISPAQTQTTAGETVEFTPRLGSGPNAPLTWTVNGVTGGTAATGTVNSAGVYTAPRAVAAPVVVEVGARYEFGSRPQAIAAVTVRPAPPALARGWIVPSAGGIIRSAGTEAVLRVPPAALTHETEVSVRLLSNSELPAPPAGMMSAGAVELLPAGLTVTQPATLQIPLRRVLPPGTPVTLQLTSSQGPADLIPATLGSDGRSATAQVGHFSTASVVFLPNPSTIAPSITLLESGVPLEEGRTVPVKLTGSNLSASAQAIVLRSTGLPVPSHEVEVTQYLGRDTEAGVCLKIGVIPGFNHSSSRSYLLRVENTAGIWAEIPFSIQGLDELHVAASETLTLTSSAVSRFSEIIIAAGGVVEVPKFDGTLDWIATGPVDIAGIIDASGPAGFNATGPQGAPSAGTAVNPTFTFGRGGNAGFNGADGDVTGVELDPIYFVGKGGEPGGNDTDITSLYANALDACSDPNSESCLDFSFDLFEFSDIAFEGYDFSDGLPTGKGGYGGAAMARGPVRPRSGHVGGGGGGTGLSGSGPGGGGGSAGWGGRGVRILSGSKIRVSGAISTRGGAGGRGANAITGLGLPANPSFAEMLVSGGGGGGGSGGEMILLSRHGVFIPPIAPFDPDRSIAGATSNLMASGGDGGPGGLYVIDRTVSGGQHTVVKRGLRPTAAKGIRGDDYIGGLPFSAAALDDGVVSSAAFVIEEADSPSLPEAEMEIQSEQTGRSRRVRVLAASYTPPFTSINGNTSGPPRPEPPYKARLLLYPGFNTIMHRPYDEDRNGQPLSANEWEILHRRVLCLPGPDSDGDDIPDADELRPDVMGNPNDQDTDDDGLRDDEEWLAGTSLADADSDGDGINDFDELHSTPPTDPQRFDSDSDGVSDGLASLLGQAALDSALHNMPIGGSLLAVSRTPTAGSVLMQFDPASGKQGALGTGYGGQPFGFTMTAGGDTWFARGATLAKATPEWVDIPDTAALGGDALNRLRRNSTAGNRGGRAPGAPIPVLGGGSSGGVTFTSWRIDPLWSNENGGIPQDSPPLDLQYPSGAPVECITLAGMDQVQSGNSFFGVEGNSQTGNTGQILFIQLSSPIAISPLGPPHPTPIRALALRKPGTGPSLLYALRAARPLENADSIAVIDQSFGTVVGTPIPVRDAAGNGLRDITGLTWNRVTNSLYACRVISNTAPWRSEIIEIDPNTGTATTKMVVPRLLSQLMAVPAGNPAYAPPVTVAGTPAGLSNPSQAITLDVDADGRDDVAVLGLSTSFQARVAVWRNTVNGFVLDSVVAMPAPFDSRVNRVMAVDVDATGGPDLVVALQNGLHILTNSGGASSPHFSSVVPLTSAPASPPAWTFGQFDGDQWPELIVAGPNSLALFQGQPVAPPTAWYSSFPAAGTALLNPGEVGPAYMKVAIADLDGAGGDPDILVRSVSNLTSAVNQGGLFRPVQNRDAADREDFPLYTGDFTGDDKVDVLSGFLGLTLFPGAGDGRFTVGGSYPTIGLAHPQIAVTGDMSLDNMDDVAVFSVNGPPRLHIFVSTGVAFTDARRSPIDLPQAGRTGTMGDFDNDGVKDDILLVTATGDLLVLTQH